MDNQVIYTGRNKRGENVRVLAVIDDSPSNPRTDWDTATIIYSSSRYVPGDRQFAVGEMLCDLLDEYVHPSQWPDDEFLDNVQEEDSNAIRDAFTLLTNAQCIIFPLYAYVHSGVALNLSGFSDPWDSGQVGFVVVPPGTADKYDNAKRIAEGEIREYQRYLNGHVYGLILQVEVEDGENWATEDSIWDVYADWNDLPKLAKEYFDL